MPLYEVPDIVLVGYGKTMTYKYKCLKCGDLYFDFDKTNVFYCFKCRESIIPLRLHLEEERFSPVPCVGNVISWKQETQACFKRSRFNFKKVYVRDNYVCQYCGYNPRTHDDFIPLSIDHIIPHSNGGGNSMDNLVVACMKCNTTLGNKVFNSFIDKKEYLRYKSNLK